jgi:hypothetical protein
MIGEVKLRKKKDKEINSMLSEPLQKAWTTFEPMLTHMIQLLQCRLLMRCPICFVKLLEIWWDFLNVRVHIKHGIVSLLVGDIMCTRSPQHVFPSIEKLTAHSMEHLILHDTVLLEHSHCWCVRNTCLRSL